MEEDLEAARMKRLQELRESMQKSRDPEVITITEARFQEIVSGQPRLVIDFWAEWCGPCRMVGPAIEELAAEFAGTVVFGKCNTDENQRVAMRLNISAIPTIMLFSQGKLIDRIIGAYPKEVLRSRIVRAFNLG